VPDVAYVYLYVTSVLLFLSGVHYAAQERGTASRKAAARLVWAAPLWPLLGLLVPLAVLYAVVGLVADAIRRSTTHG
jgi:hypothetical protein